MEPMFSKIMEGFMKGMSEEDKKAIWEMMAAMCSCMGTKDMSDEDRKAMREKMIAFCGSKMEMMSSCFGKASPAADQSCCSEKR